MPLVSKNSTNGKSLLPQNNTVTRSADGSITVAGASINSSLLTAINQGVYEGIGITRSTIDDSIIGQQVPCVGYFQTLSTPTISASTCLFLDAKVAVTVAETIPIFLDGVCSTETDNRPGLVGTSSHALQLYGTSIDIPNSKPLNLGSGGSYMLGTSSGSLYLGGPKGIFTSTNEFTFQSSSARLKWQQGGSYLEPATQTGGLTLCARGDALILSAPDYHYQVRVSQTSSLHLDHSIPLTFEDAPHGQIGVDTHGAIQFSNPNIGITIPTLTPLNIGSSTSSPNTSSLPPQLFDSDVSGYASNRTLTIRNREADTSTIQEGRAIVISSDLIIFEGDVEFKKKLGQVEYETVKSQAPILYIGDNTINNHFDRGIICVYDTTNQYFIGYQEREQAFVCLSQAIVGTDELVRGNLSRIEVSGIDAGSSPSFNLGTTSSYPVLPQNGGRLQFGSTINGYLDSTGLLSGLDLTLGSGKLNLGQSVIQQDAEGQLHLIPASSYVLLDKASLVFGSSTSLNYPILNAIPNQNEFQYQNINHFTWNNTTGQSLGWSIRLAEDGVTPVLYFDGDLQLSGDNLVWAGVPIPSSGGGGGGGSDSYFTLAKAVPFVASTSSQYKQLTTSASFQFDSTTNTLQVPRLSLQQPNGSSMTTGALLYQDGTSNGGSGTNNLVIQSSTGIQLAGPLYGKNQVAHIAVATTFDFQDNALGLLWKSGSGGSNSIGIQGNSSTHSITLTDSASFLAWGSDQAVGFVRQDDTSSVPMNHLYFKGQNLHIPVQSNLCLGQGYTIRDTGNQQIGLQIDGNMVTFSPTTQVRFQGDVSYTGRVTLTSTDHLDINSNFLNLGASRKLDIVSIVNGTATNGVNITTSAGHGFLGGEIISINGEDCLPSLNSSNNTFQVTAVLSSTMFAIIVPSLNGQPLIKMGTSGLILAPLTMDPGTDVGIQFSHFSSSNTPPVNGYFFYQHSTQSFILADVGNNDQTNDVIQVTSYGTLQLQQLNATYLGAVTLKGNLDASNYLVSGSNFKILGGSLDNWSTSTRTLIQNLNAELFNGYSSSAFVQVNGSTPLTQTWNTSLNQDPTIGLQTSFLDVWNLTVNDPQQLQLQNEPIVFISSSTATHARLSTSPADFYFNLPTKTLVTNIDVSNHQLTLANGQVPPVAIGPGLANIDISGNSQTVTHGVYTTDFNHDSSLLVADHAQMPYNLQVPPSSVAVTNAQGQWGSIPLTSLSSTLTIERLNSLSTDPHQPSLMNPIKQWSILIGSNTKEEETDETLRKFYFITLPNGVVDGATHLFSAQIVANETIQVQIPLLTPTFTDVPSYKTLYMTNGCSCEVIWDDVAKIYLIRNTGGYFPCDENQDQTTH